MRRWIALAAALLGGSAAFGGDAQTGIAQTPSPQLVYMQQVRPVTITPQSVSVDANGDGAVIVVIGELTIPKPTRFRLDARALARLHRLLREAKLADLHIVAPIPVRALMYTVRSDGHQVRVVQGHVPARLRGLVDFLHGLIGRYGYGS
jgi:hypothetical protein